MAVWNDGSTVQHSLLKFDLSSIPAGAAINSATLTLVQWTFGQPSGTESDVWAAARPWDVNASWNNATSGTPWTTPGGDFTGVAGTPYASNSQYIPDVDLILHPNGAGSPVSWDVANLVSAWKSGAIPDYGMLLSGTLGEKLHFLTSSYPDSSLRPTLTVSYTAVPTPTPAALTSGLLIGLGLVVWGKRRLA